MRVLVVYKHSFLESHHSDAGFMSRIGRPARSRIVQADAEHRGAIGEVVRHLLQCGIPHDVIHRRGEIIRRRYDLVISVGGDGTFLAAASHLRDTPIMGVNSDPSVSLGLWTCADRHTFPDRLEQALAGALKATKLERIIVSINGKPVRECAMNDVLFAHKSPAAMTRYRIEAGRLKEDQKSSGVWVATAAGSTAAIRSAGGSTMPLGSKLLQYLIREPYHWPKDRLHLLGGRIRRLALVPLGLETAISLDGHRTHYDLGVGDMVELKPGHPLSVLGVDAARRQRLFP